jgi:nucleolar protein 58
MTEVSFGMQEWYGWHFPEMAKIIVDNVAYAKVVQAMGEGGVLLRPTLGY